MGWFHLVSFGAIVKNMFSLQLYEYFLLGNYISRSINTRQEGPKLKGDRKYPYTLYRSQNYVHAACLPMTDSAYMPCLDNHSKQKTGL